MGGVAYDLLDRLDPIRLRCAESQAETKVRPPTPFGKHGSVHADLPPGVCALTAVSPVKCPDFTNGRWKTTKPKFAVDG
jgi:hypothetical protein